MLQRLLSLRLGPLGSPRDWSTLHWALLHQGFALIVLGFAAAHWRGTKGAYPLPTAIMVAR